MTEGFLEPTVPTARIVSSNGLEPISLGLSAALVALRAPLETAPAGPAGRAVQAEVW